MKRPGFWISMVLALGLILLFVGERLLVVGRTRELTSLAGAGLVGLAVLFRLVRWVRADTERRWVERTLLLLHLLVVVALLGYLAGTELFTQRLGGPLERRLPLGAKLIALLWPALLAVALTPTLLVEVAAAAMWRAPRLELGRVRAALYSGLGLTFALIFAASAYFVASERNEKWDLSYFRTARPGQATLQLVRALDAPVEVTAFFPPANEVREQVQDYLDALARESPHLEVAVLDHALDPVRAKELGVSGNGTLVVARGERRELFGVGLELERARGQLRDLDRELQKRLLQVARARRTLYFTVGHGERGADKMSSIDQRWTVRELRALWGAQNLEVKNLGAAEGLAQAVPEDAAAVVVMGPERPFLPEEVSALVRYHQRGGRLLLALDPESSPGLQDLLEAVGLKYRAQVLANDVAYVPRTGQPSDHAMLGTAAYSSHPAVTTLGRLGAQAPLVLFTAGALEVREGGAPRGVRADVAVRSHPATWADLDGNYRPSAEEPRRQFDLAYAVSGSAAGTPEGEQARLFVISDSDLFGDPIIQNRGNYYLAMDSMRWLTGEEAVSGEIGTEQDVVLQHTRKQNVAWFYSTVFLAPAVVLGLGFVLTRHRSRRRRRPAGGEVR